MTPVAAPQVSTATTLMTADEFAARYEHVHAELVKGIVKECPVPMLKHGKICMTIGRFIGNFVADHDLGHTMSTDSWIKTASNPDTVCGSDICYFSYERLPKGDIPEGLLSVVPELVVEVRSPTDRWSDIFEKVNEYLKAGVRVVMVIDPRSTSASLYRDEELQQIYHNSDVLTIPEVLPGFSVVVSTLFS